MENKLKDILQNAYAPYSKYKVGAILVTNDNREFIGVNVEIASYGGTICAERNAILNAVANGYRKGDFKALYIMNDSDSIGLPCMICRQSFIEFFNNDMKVVCYSSNGENVTKTVGELCPFPFSEDDLK